MKTAQLLALLLFLAGKASFAQGGLTLNAGDSYVYQFSNLPLQSISLNPGKPDNLSVNFQLGSFTTNGSLLAEMFEDSTSEVPVASQTLTYDPSLSIPAPLFAILLSPNAWQDLQGVVRFSMLSGSATITQFRVKTVLTDPAGYAIHWEIIQPVPEPSLFSLVGVGSVIFCLKIGKCHAA